MGRQALNSKNKHALHAAALAVAMLGGGSTWALPQAEPAASMQPGVDSADNSEQSLCLADPLCRAHFTRARKLSKAEDFEGALAAYQAAYRRREAPWLLVNIGRTMHKLGRPQEAVNYFKQFLASPGTQPVEVQEKARQFLREAEQDLASKPSEPKNRPPEPKKAVASGSESSGGTATATGSLPEDGKGVVGPASKPQPPAPVAAPNSRWLSAPFLAGVAGGGAVLVAGAITGGLALSSSSQLRNTAYVGDPGMTQLTLQQRTISLTRATDVLIPIGAAAIAATVLVTALWRPRSTEPSGLGKRVAVPVVTTTDSAAPASDKPPDKALEKSPDGPTEKAPEPPAPPASVPVSQPTTLIIPTAYIGSTGLALSLSCTF